MTLIPAPNEKLRLITKPLQGFKWIYGDVKKDLSAFFNSKTRKTMDPIVKLEIPLNIMMLGAVTLLTGLLSPVTLPVAGVRKLKEKRTRANGQQPA